MKHIVVFLIYIYRLLLQSIFNRFSSCRYEPSCSHYMEQAVDRYGFKGFLMGVRRIFSCHPFSKRPIYDPVDETEAQ